MIKKVQTTKERHFARKRTTLAFMRAIMREHRLSGPCCRKRERFLIPSKIVIFLNFARRKVERTVEREEAEDSAARFVRFIVLVRHCFYFFLFFCSMKGYGALRHYARRIIWVVCFSPGHTVARVEFRRSMIMLRIILSLSQLLVISTLKAFINILCSLDMIFSRTLFVTGSSVFPETYSNFLYT